MRCMACGAEMILTNVVQDETMAVPGGRNRFRSPQVLTA